MTPENMFDDSDPSESMAAVAASKKGAAATNGASALDAVCTAEAAEELPAKPKRAKKAAGAAPSSSGSKAAIPDAPRGNMFFVALDRLTLVTDPRHYLYRPDVRAPLDDRFVARMAAEIKTNLLPLIVCKDGDALLITDGRTRYRAVVEKINPQRAKEGLEPIEGLWCVLSKGDEKLQVETSVDAHLRKVDTPYTSAIVCGHYLQRLGDREDRYDLAAARFGVSGSCVRVWERVFGLSAKLKGAVEKGAITITEAAKFHDKAREVQDTVAEKALAEQAKGPKKRAGKRPGKAQVAAACEAVKSDKARALLMWLQGRGNRKAVIEAFPELDGVIK